MQRKTAQAVDFELSDQSRQALAAWIGKAQLAPKQFLFPRRLKGSPDMPTRQYAPIAKSWVAEIGLVSADYGSYSLRRTKATLIYKRTKNLRAGKLLLGYIKLESTIRYLGIEVDDTLGNSEHTED